MKRYIAAALLFAFTAGCYFFSYGAGTVSDPLVTRGHLETIYSAPMRQKAQEAGDRLIKEGHAMLDEKMVEIGGEVMSEAAAQLVYERVMQKVALKNSSLDTSNMKTVTLKKGDKISGALGTGFMLTSGSAQVSAPYGGDIVNTAAGRGDADGTALIPYVYYIVPEGSGLGAVVTSERAVFLMRDGVSYTPLYTEYADKLNSVGLFRGTNRGYELERSSTRQEALIMLIRLIGEEDKALAYTGGTTFMDLTGWADGQKYIAYGQSRGLTNGESATVYAQGKAASLEMYLTFVLRALGYNDSAGDFVWNTTSKTLALELGLIDQKMLDNVAQNGFLRDHMVFISYNALNVKIKGSVQTLGQWLEAGGVIDYTP